jgi:chromosome segregation ATPase
MVSLEQVRALEDRVEKAVAYIASLREEGDELKRRLAESQSFIDEAAEELAAAEEKNQAAEKRAEEAAARRDEDAEKIRGLEARIGDMAQRVAAAETRVAELNARAEEYRKDQAKIEEGIVHALSKLDSFEDLVLAQTSASAEASPAEAPAAAKAAPPAKKPEPAAEAEKVDSGIAVKAVPEIEAEGGSEGAQTLENELDIF